jgi:hypothetical protein
MMVINYLKPVLFVIFTIISSSVAFAAETGGDFQYPPGAVLNAVQKDQPYYAGMTKNELFSLYPDYTQQSYYKEGNQEWILCDDIMTDGDDKDVIAFYLKDGVVSGWFKKEVPKTPEERLKAVETRRSRHGGQNMDTNGSGQEAKGRRPIYQPPRFNINYY